MTAHVPEDRADAIARGVTDWLRSVATIDPAACDARVSTTEVPAVDWDALFRDHHRPLAIGNRLLVAPPWDVPEAPGREVLVIEPGMAFGTGQHETTRTCLEEIELAVASGGVRTALDVGTGSGVLAAALARLGVPRVVALDVDAAVLPLARANLARNGPAGSRWWEAASRLHRGRPSTSSSPTSWPTRSSSRPSTLVERVAAPGRLVVSGVLDTQADAVAAAFPTLRLAHTRAAGPWRTLRLER